MFWETTKQNSVRSPHASVAKVMPALIIIIAKIEEGVLENTNTGTSKPGYKGPRIYIFFIWVITLISV